MAQYNFTISASGGDYTSLAAYVSGEATDLVTAGNNHVVTLDTSGLDSNTAFSGFTTNAANNIKLIVASGREHGGQAGNYVINSTNANPVLRPVSTCDGLHVDGLGIKSVNGTISRNNGAIDYIVENCWLESTSTTVDNCDVYIASSSNTIKNNFIKGGNDGILSYPDTGNLNYYNTVYNTANRGIYGGIQKNNIAVGSTLTDYASSQTGSDYNLSSDTTAPGSNSLTSKAASNQFVSVTAGSEDLNLKSGADAIGAATPIGGITTDYAGNSRDASTPDMGANEHVATGTTKTVSDTGSGSDAVGGISASVPRSDTGSGSDSASIAASAHVADSGTGVDSVSVSVSLSVSDIGSGADAVSHDVLVGISDTGSGVDALLVSAAVAVSDSGTGADVANALILITPSDIGSGADAISIAAQVGVSDSGSGVDSASIAAAAGVSDAASGADSVSISFLISPPADTSAGADSVSVAANVAPADSGVGTDSVSITVDVAVSDTASGNDSVSTFASGNTKTVAESGTGADVATVHDHILTQVQLFQDANARPYIYLGEALFGPNYLAFTSSFNDTDENEENQILYAGAVWFVERADSSADTWGTQRKLVSPNRIYMGRFGQVLDISNQDLIIGAPGEERAYVAKRVGGIPQIITAIASPAPSGYGFAWDVCCDDSFTTFVVTLPWGTSGGFSKAGYAIVYGWNPDTQTLMQVAMLTASDQVDDNRLGYKCQISGDGSRVVLSAYTPDGRGKVYVYDKGAGWTSKTEDQLLQSDNPGSQTNFGTAESGNGVEFYTLTPLAITYDGSVLIVGEPWSNNNGSRSGSVYFFYDSGSGFAKQQRIDGGAGAYLGDSVYISPSENHCVFSIQRADVDGVARAGKIRLYSLSVTGVPTYLQTGFETTPYSFDYLGYRVSMDDTHIAAVASDYDGAATDAGAIVMFRYVDAAIRETGVGTDSVNITADIRTVSIHDNATAVESIPISASLAVSDTAESLDGLNMVQDLKTPGADSGTGTDSIKPITAQVPLSETAIGTDSVTITVSLTVSDSGGSSESVRSGIQITVSDVGSAIDSVLRDLLATTSDTGTAVDSVSVTKAASTGINIDKIRITGKKRNISFQGTTRKVHIAGSTRRIKMKLYTREFGIN